VTTFAVDKIYLGDTDPDGTADATNGWTHFGYNIDGVASAPPTAFCKPLNNANAATVHQHGLGGLENSFGHNILPIILGLTSNASANLNQQIQAGAFTYLISLSLLGTNASANPIASNVAAGAPLGGTPRWDGSDVWPPLSGTAASLPQSYLVASTWVSAPVGTVNIPVGLLGLALSAGSATNGVTVPLNHAVLSMALDATHQKATSGIISGVLPTAALVAQIVQIAGTIDPALCSGATIDSIVAQLQQASDILQDGTQDPTKSCDGISLGLGFDATLVKLGQPVSVTPPPNPCGDGG
jgi:hypothetical protein